MSGDFFREANYGLLSATFRQACIDADTRSNKHSNGRNSDQPISLAAPKSRLVTINASSVKPKNIDFIWPGRLAKGKHTCFAGEGGLGKSQLLVAITAALTTGGAWPCGEGQAPIVNVIILSAEDGVDDVLVPRLMAAGADRTRVHIVRAIKAEDGRGERRFSLQEDLEELEKRIAEIGDVGLVWIDPVTSYMGKVDSHNNTALRGILDPISEMAERTNVAFASVTHFTKGSADKGIKAMHRVMGGAAFTTAPRAAFAIIEDPDDSNRRLLLHLKNNLAVKAQGLAFRLGAQMVGIDDRTDTEIWASHILWEDKPVETTADEAVAAFGGHSEERGALDEAMEFLLAELAEGRVDVTVIQAAAKRAGIADRTLKRARAELKITRQREGFGPGGKFFLVLPGPHRGPSNA
jgi:putative DNA primase/helicase